MFLIPCFSLINVLKSLLLPCCPGLRNFWYFQLGFYALLWGGEDQGKGVKTAVFSPCFPVKLAWSRS